MHILSTASSLLSRLSRKKTTLIGTLVLTLGTAVSFLPSDSYSKNTDSVAEDTQDQGSKSVEVQGTLVPIGQTPLGKIKVTVFAAKDTTSTVISDKTFSLEVETDEDTLKVQIDAPSPMDRKFHPALFRASTSELNAGITVLMIPLRWTIQKGAYAGQTVQISIYKALSGARYVTSMFFGGLSVGRRFTGTPESWKPEDRPVPVALFNAVPDSTITEEDSTKFWNALKQMESIFGRDLFRQTTPEQIGWDGGNPPTGTIGAVVDTTVCARALSEAGKRLWAWSSTSSRVWQEPPPSSYNIAGHYISFGKTLWCHRGGFPTGIVQHETLHAMGLGHGSLLPSVMAYPLEEDKPINSRSLSRDSVTSHDVAYWELRDRVINAASQHQTRFNFLPALFGERVLMRGLKPIPNPEHWKNSAQEIVPFSTEPQDESDDFVFGGTGLTMDFVGVERERPGKVVYVLRHNSSPVTPVGIKKENIGEYRFVIIKDPELNPDKVVVHIDVSTLSGIDDAGNVTVFRRPERATGPFEELETEYDEGSNELVVTVNTSASELSLGEFAFASDTEPLRSPNEPPVAGSDSFTTVEGQTLAVGAPGVLANDSDPDEDRLYATAVSTPSHGDLTLKTHGSFEYVPNKDFSGTDSFVYEATDDDGAADTASVTLTVQNVKDSSITSIVPESGTPSTQVRVNGTGFGSLTGGEKSLTFGDATAQVDSTGRTTMHARVPSGPVGPVELSVSTETSDLTAAKLFTVITEGSDTLTPSLEGLPSVTLGSSSFGDVDGDGDLDLLITGSGQPTLYENDGNGSFVPMEADLRRISDSDSEFSESSSGFGDIDGDGDLDLLVDGQYQATLYENDGTGSFTPIGADLSEGGDGSVDFGDVDRDGDLDVLITGSEQATLYENRADGSFVPMGAGFSGTRDGSAALGDLDGDGDLDVVQTGTVDVGGPAITEVYENNGDGDFELINSNLKDVKFSSLDLGDFDSDGDLDLVLTGTTENSDRTATLYRNDGSGSFTPVQAGLSGVRHGSSEFGDVDGDGDVDLLITGSGQATLYENKGNESFAPMGVGLSGVFYSSSELEDADGDGDLDLLTTGRFQTTLYENGLLAAHSDTVESDGSEKFGETGVEIVFSGISTSGEVTVEKLDGPPTGVSGILEQNVSDYRFVVESGSALQFDSSEVRIAVGSLSGIEDPTNVQVYKREEVGTGSFEALETTVDDSGTPEAVSDDTISVWTKGFSEFALASDTEPLPVELTDFDALVEDKKVHLTWETASENRNAGFEIQRKAKPQANWKKVGWVESKGGSNSELNSYQFTDRNLPFAADSLSYRLRQVDTDGSASLTEKVVVKRPVDEVQLLKTYPNPARNQATLKYAVPERQRVTIRLYDVLGRKVGTVAQGVKKGRHETRLDVSGLTSGIYFLRLKTEGTTKTQRLTVVR